jgi:hypothetical protein
LTCSSSRGTVTFTWLSRPLYAGGASAAGVTRLRRSRRIMGLNAGAPEDEAH